MLKVGRRGGIRTHDEIALSGFKDRRQTARLHVNWKMVGRPGIEPESMPSQGSVLSILLTSHGTGDRIRTCVVFIGNEVQ